MRNPAFGPRAAAVLLFLLAPLSVIHAQVKLGGPLQGVLSADLSPYLMENSGTVEAGTELLLEPGVELLFAPDTRLTVHGTLESQGTEDKPVILKALRDDAPWLGLHLRGEGRAGLFFTRLQGSPTALHMDHESHLALYSCRVSAVYTGLVHRGQGGLHSEGTLWSGMETALDLREASGAARLAGNTFMDLSVPVRMAPDTSLASTDSRLHEVASPGLMLDGPLQSAASLVPQDLPFRFTGVFEVGLRGTLSLQPGVILEAEPGPATALRVAGALYVAGDREQPVFIGTPAEEAGQWRGIELVLEGTLEARGLHLRGAQTGLLIDPLAEGSMALADSRLDFTHTGLHHGGPVSLALESLLLEHMELGLNLAGEGSTRLNLVQFASVDTPGEIHPHHRLEQQEVSQSGGRLPGLVLKDSTLTGTGHFAGHGLPLVLMDTLTVSAEAQLTLEEGVTLLAAEGLVPALKIAGQLKAQGSATRPVQFSALNGSWGGVEIAGQAELSHVHFQNADLALDLQGEGMARLLKMTFRDNGTALRATDGATLHLQNSLLAMNNVALDISTPHAHLGGSASPGGNDILGSHEADLIWRGAGTQMAHGNWWGENPPARDELKTPGGGRIDLAKPAGLPSMANLNPRFAPGQDGSLTVLWEDLGVELSLIVETSTDPTFTENLTTELVTNGEEVENTGTGDTGEEGDVTYYRVTDDGE